MATEPTTTSPSDAIVEPAGAHAMSPTSGTTPSDQLPGSSQSPGAEAVHSVVQSEGSIGRQAARPATAPPAARATSTNDHRRRRPATAIEWAGSTTCERARVRASWLSLRVRAAAARGGHRSRAALRPHAGRTRAVLARSVCGASAASAESRHLAGSAGHRAVVERRTASDVGHTGVMEQLDDATVSDRARRLAGALEPFAGQVYFSPECHTNYERLGFSASPGDANGVALPDGPAYFTSRGSVMGQVAGRGGRGGLRRVQPRHRGAAGRRRLVDDRCRHDLRAPAATAPPRSCVRILGDEPDGLDRVIDLLEQRHRGPAARGSAAVRRSACPTGGPATRWATPGTSPTSCASTAATATPPRGSSPASTPPRSACSPSCSGACPMRSYVRSRAWSNDELDAAEARLVERGLAGRRRVHRRRPRRSASRSSW